MQHVKLAAGTTVEPFKPDIDAAIKAMSECCRIAMTAPLEHSGAFWDAAKIAALNTRDQLSIVTITKESE